MPTPSNIATTEAPSKGSLLLSLASLPESQRQRILSQLSEEEAAALLYDWRFWARPDQLPPEGSWQFWLLMAGRGAGKTWAGAHWIRDRVENHGALSLGLIAATAADARDVMVEGPSGILAVSPPWNEPLYEPSKRRVTWPNGAVGHIYSADEPRRLRGPQHDSVWCDELAAWEYSASWDNMIFGLRMGADPRAVITTTPQPRNIIRQLLKDPHCTVTRATTYDNLIHLAPSFIDKLVTKYEGTRLGRQELRGELLEDVEGALWNAALIEQYRAMNLSRRPDFVRIVVAVDPAVTSGENADDTGIMVVGLANTGHCYVLEDATCHVSPGEWAQIVIDRYNRWRADRVVGEVNNGGDLIEAVLRSVSEDVSYRSVHASRGKRVRAEPIAALYEQGKVHHWGFFPDLEDQMCNFTPDTSDTSPDRVDALVWGITELTEAVDVVEEVELMELITI